MVVKTIDIFGETAFMTYFFIWDQDNRPGVDEKNIYLVIVY